MIVANIKGGLGNQMFQIGAGVSLANRLDTKFGINYNLKHNCIQGYPHTKYKDNLFANISETDYVPNYRYSEPEFAYKPIEDRNDMLIDGYFQSSKYFDNTVKDIFNFPESITKKIDNKLANIPQKKIGVHIRRGDYKIYSSTHPLQTVDYYTEAMRDFSIDYASNNCVYILCTDDIGSVQSEFDMSKFIYSNCKSEIEDLYLLSQCDSIIMSNSTFAWWGAYLGKAKEKVIAPKIWFGLDGPQDYNDIYLNDWKRL